MACYNLAFNTVHALYRERYAYRENMCDVIIQHLVSSQKVRIKCRGLVNKIAIYRNRLAVQLPERVVLYELSSAENQPMHYKVKEKIGEKFDCSLLVVCAQHLVLCQEKKLQSLDFTGVLQREWVLDSFIRYIKVTGGPAGREGLFLGLKNGQVWRIFLDNSLPMLITTVLSSVRCLDLNSTRSKLAIVDDAGRLVVRDLINDTILYQVCKEKIICFPKIFQIVTKISNEYRITALIQFHGIHIWNRCFAIHTQLAESVSVSDLYHQEVLRQCSVWLLDCVERLHFVYVEML